LKLSKASSTELDVLRELFQPLGIGSLGSSADVTDNRKRYNKLEFLTAWKVSSGPEMSMYLEARKDLQHKRVGAKLWVDTCRNDVQQMARDNRMTDDNEYLLLRGFKAKRLKENLCKNEDEEPNKDPYKSNYGFGFYLSDASDKIDQYTGGAIDTSSDVAQNNLKDFEELVGAQDPSFQQLATLSQDPSVGDIYFAPVVRTYLGKHIEVQIDYQSCFSKQTPDERDIMWYFRDPYTREDVVMEDPPVDITVCQSTGRSYCLARNSASTLRKSGMPNM